MKPIPTPSQTCGPLFGFALLFDGSTRTVDPDHEAAVWVRGRIVDGDGCALTWPDGLVEVWNGDQFGRAQTDDNGEFRFCIHKPEPSTLADGTVVAPHLQVAVFARGLLKQVQTRMYFPDAAAHNAQDPVLQAVPPDRRSTLLAREEGDELRFDVVLQGDDETVFFAY